MPEILTNTIEGHIKYPINASVSGPARDLTEKLLANKPQERISLEEALKHEWFEVLRMAEP